MKVAIIIPAFNEEKSIKSLVTACAKYPCDVLVFDDNSTDSTYELAKQTEAICFKNPRNLGYEKNIYSAIKTCIQLGYQYGITIDADGQHNPLNIETVLQKFEEGFELVMGYRNVFPRESEQLIHFIGYKLFNVIDPLCGFKGYKLTSIGDFDFSKDDTIATSLFIYMLNHGVKKIEIPIEAQARKNGESSFEAGL